MSAGDALDQLTLEREERKARMMTSNWIAAAEGGSREYVPVSSTQLDAAYQRSKSVTRSEYLSRLQSRAEGAAAREAIAPASEFVASKYRTQKASQGAGVNMVLGYDPVVFDTSNVAYGATSRLPSERIDLLETVPKLRDPTLDGAHRASMTESHFLPIWDPYISQHRIRSASFASAGQLRESMHRHVRSQYHPEEKYVLPPTVQSEIGWGLNPEMYKKSCAKFQEGAEWHGRAGSHITKFSERVLLGARHHLSGPSELIEGRHRTTLSRTPPHPSTPRRPYISPRPSSLLRPSLPLSLVCPRVPARYQNEAALLGSRRRARPQRRARCPAACACARPSCKGTGSARAARTALPLQRATREGATVRSHTFARARTTCTRAAPCALACSVESSQTWSSCRVGLMCA